MTKLLKSKRAMITGAGSGMGKEIAKLFYEEGAKLSLLDLNEESLTDHFNNLDENRVILTKVDVTNPEDIKKAVNQMADKFGGIDILINCAGVPQSFTPIEELEIDDWDKTLNVNLKSVFLTIKYVVPIMKAQQEGAIVNIASIAGVRARPGLNAYCASKAGNISLSQSLALELAEFNIRVNVINPGPTKTPMLSKFMQKGVDEEETKNKVFLDSIPMKKFVEPIDIANAALYLSSQQARIVTGEVLNVDGGRGV